MKKQSILSNKNTKSRLSFHAGSDNREVLRMLPNGRILWFVDGKEIEVIDKSILTIALIDLVVQLTNLKYDYSKIDPELWEKYKEFIKTRKKMINQ